MLTYTSSLLVGPYDWLPERIPLHEFARRIEAVRTALHARGMAGVIVHGKSIDYAAMAYLTGFVPKLNAAFAFMGLEGPIRILFPGGAAMADAAKRLTFVEDVRSLTDLKADAAMWLAEKRIEDRDIALWDGSTLSKDDHNLLIQGLGTNRLIEFNCSLDPLRRVKSTVEHKAVMKAAAAVNACFAAAEKAVQSGADTQTVVLAAERAGYLLGAQDIRIRISTTDQGTPNIISDIPESIRLDPRNIYVAARVFGYWTQAITTLGTETSLKRRARNTLDACLNALNKDKTIPLHNFLSDAKNTNSLSIEVNGIGLSLREAPIFANLSSTHPLSDKAFDTGVFSTVAPVVTTLANGDICSIIVEAREGAHAGFASALIVVTKDRIHTLNLPA